MNDTAMTAEEMADDLRRRRLGRANRALEETNGHDADDEPPAREIRRAATSRQHNGDLQRALPSSPDAERGLVASMLLDPRRVIPGVLKVLTPPQFHDARHRTIVTQLMEMQASDEEIDFTTLTADLHRHGKLAAAGGANYVTDLFTHLPTSALWESYIEPVRDAAAKRELIAFGDSLRESAYTPGAGAHEILDRARRRLDMVGGSLDRRSALPALLDMRDMMQNPPALPDELVEGLVHKGTQVIIGGSSKGKKTWSLLDMAISCATGSEWWGYKTKRSRVCYINYEIPAAFFPRRAKAICEAKGTPMPDAGQLLYWNLRGHVEGIERMADDLMAELVLHGLDLIIFDPVYMMLGGRDENKAGDVASLLNELQKISVRLGATIAYGAHYSKGNQAAKESIDRMGGSGVFARYPDTILAMTAHEEEDCFTVEATLRNLRGIDPFVVHWDGNQAPGFRPVFTRDDSLDPAQLKQPATAQKGKRDNAKRTEDGKYDVEHTMDDVVEALTKGPMLYGELMEWLEKMMSERTAKQLVADARKAGLVDQDGGKGTLWRIREK